MIENRRDKRYVVPTLYGKYITFKIKNDSGEFVPVELYDFNLNGIKIRSPLLLWVDSVLECLISVPKSLTKEIPIAAKIKYCVQDEPRGDYLIGAEIIRTSDGIWLEVFSKVHDFIKGRIGEIY